MLEILGRPGRNSRYVSRPLRQLRPVVLEDGDVVDLHPRVTAGRPVPQEERVVVLDRPQPHLDQRVLTGRRCGDAAMRRCGDAAMR